MIIVDSKNATLLVKPILNKYWKETSWKLNQDFFINPISNWDRFKKTGVDWLVVDESRPSSNDFSKIATLKLKSHSMSLWKIDDPYQGEVPQPLNPCDSKSNF